jgi:NhaP-type Na+/H+ or K+/H+ antiporter
MSLTKGLIGPAKLRAEPLPFKWRHILFWGGGRGSLSIAPALSLPMTLPGRERLVAMIFGAAIFSLLAQGLTISPLPPWLNLSTSQLVRSLFQARRFNHAMWRYRGYDAG